MLCLRLGIKRERTVFVFPGFSVAGHERIGGDGDRAFVLVGSLASELIDHDQLSTRRRDPVGAVRSRRFALAGAIHGLPFDFEIAVSIRVLRPRPGQERKVVCSIKVSASLFLAGIVADNSVFFRRRLHAVLHFTGPHPLSSLFACSLNIVGRNTASRPTLIDPAPEAVCCIVGGGCLDWCKFENRAAPSVATAPMIATVIVTLFAVMASTRFALLRGKDSCGLIAQPR